MKEGSKLCRMGNRYYAYRNDGWDRNNPIHHSNSLQLFRTLSDLLNGYVPFQIGESYRDKDRQRAC